MAAPPLWSELQGWNLSGYVFKVPKAGEKSPLSALCSEPCILSSLFPALLLLLHSLCPRGEGSSRASCPPQSISGGTVTVIAGMGRRVGSHALPDPLRSWQGRGNPSTHCHCYCHCPSWAQPSHSLPEAGRSSTQASPTPRQWAMEGEKRTCLLEQRGREGFLATLGTLKRLWRHLQGQYACTAGVRGSSWKLGFNQSCSMGCCPWTSVRSWICPCLCIRAFLNRDLF